MQRKVIVALRFIAYAIWKTRSSAVAVIADRTAYDVGAYSIPVLADSMIRLCHSMDRVYEGTQTLSYSGVTIERDRPKCRSSRNQ